MTSGEALWRDIEASRVAERGFYQIERTVAEAVSRSEGLDFTLDPLDDADAVLLMGAPDGTEIDEWRPVLQQALAPNLSIHCSSPDQTRPRADVFAISPGVLAQNYESLDGQVHYCGKPCRPVLDALKNTLNAWRPLMIGDIVGAAHAGLDSAHIQNGTYRDRLAEDDAESAILDLSAIYAVSPTFALSGIA